MGLIITLNILPVYQPSWIQDKTISPKRIQIGLHTDHIFQTRVYIAPVMLYFIK